MRLDHVFVSGVRTEARGTKELQLKYVSGHDVFIMLDKIWREEPPVRSRLKLKSEIRSTSDIGRSHI